MSSFPPPSFPAGAGAPTSGWTAPIASLSKALVVLVAIYIPLHVLGVVNTVRVSDKAQRFLDDEVSRREFREANDFSVLQIGGLLVIPIAVVTMIWMFRMASNLRALGRQGQTWSSAWAMAGWFLPPGFVYAIPWLMFRELWKGSDPAITRGDGRWKSGRVPPLIDVWWVLYGLLPLLGLFTTGQLIAQLNSGDDDLEDVAERFADDRIFFLIVGVGGLLAAIAFLAIVRQLSARHMAATGEGAG